MKWICVNFSSIHQQYKTELWVAATLGLWAAAVLVHSVENYERKDGSLTKWIIEIFVAFIFAAGFGWHLHKCYTLHRMEKRGKFHSSAEEFGTVQL